MGKRGASAASAGTSQPAAKRPAEEPRRGGRARPVVHYAAEREAAVEEAEADEGGSGGASKTRASSYAPSTPKRPIALCDPDPTASQRNARGELVFQDHPEFTPRLTPQQVIRAGSFGGCYFHPRGGKPGILHPKEGVDIDPTEFPASWFAGLDPVMYASRKYNVPTNKHRVKAGQGQAEWEKSGWIQPQDPRGWFQWYCRFYLGRRTQDDARQIGRWSGVAGVKGRWKRTLLNKIVAANARWDDGDISPVVRQTLLHWAYEVTQQEVEAWAAGKADQA